MDASTNSKSKLPGRSTADASTRDGRRPVRGAGATTTDVAPQHPAEIGRAVSSLPNAALVFKKTPCIAGLQPAGRDVAKDIEDVGSIPLLMTTRRDHGFLHGDPLTLFGRTIPQQPKSVTWTPHQGVVRRMRPVTKAGRVGPDIYHAPEGVLGKVAGMSNLQVSGSAGRFNRESAVETRTGEGTPLPLADDVSAAAHDVNLTDDDRAAGKSKRTPGATDHMSGALWKYAQQVRSAIRGAANRRGGAAENCYANV